MEAITRIPPSAAMSGAATTHVKPEQSQAKPVVQNVEKAGKPEASQESPVSKEHLKMTLEQLNKQFSSEGIGFVYEERLSQLFVQIKDKATGAVVKEVPPKAVIDHMVAMKEMVGMILDRKV